MKSALPVLSVILALQHALFAGSLGPGPWANGAYYPGQYDGVYTASVFGGSSNVISGIISFGIDKGTVSTATNSTGSTNTVTVNPFQNNYVVFLNGRSYVGLTLANLDPSTKAVSGGLLTGNSEPTIISTPLTTTTINNTCGGAFTARITSDKSIIKFKGDDTGTLSTSTNGVPVLTNTFSLSGSKVGNQFNQ